MPKGSFLHGFSIAWGVLFLALSQGFSQSDTTGQKVHDMAEKYGISADSVQHLKDHYNVGYGGVGHALSLAQASGLSSEEILAMKVEQKMGWGLIRRRLGVSPVPHHRLPEQALARHEAQMQKKMERALAKQEKRQNRGKK